MCSIVRFSLVEGIECCCWFVRWDENENREKIVVDISLPLVPWSNYNVESHLLVVSLPQSWAVCTLHPASSTHTLVVDSSIKKSKVIHSHNLIEQRSFIEEEKRAISFIFSFFSLALLHGTIVFHLFLFLVIRMIEFGRIADSEQFKWKMRVTNYCCKLTSASVDNIETN